MPKPGLPAPTLLPRDAAQPAPRANPAGAGLGRRMSWLCLMALLLSAAEWASGYAKSAAFLLRLTGAPVPAPLASWAFGATREASLTLKLDGGDVRARLYMPADTAAGPGIVLLHGVHPRGIDEPRLTAFARGLAALGNRVLTPELPELLAYHIDASTIERIRDIARNHATRTGQAAVGVIGISFAGGLALLAAARHPERTPFAFVVAVGAHHDLWRLTRYYADQPVFGPHGEATRVTPHPYGARVLLREHLDHFFSAADLATAELVLDTYLRDQHPLAKRRALGLSAEGQRVMSILLDESRHGELDALLLQAAELARPSLDAASPKGQLARLRSPVFLVHGATDPVIPSIETLWLAQEVPAHALRRSLVTALLRHAEFPTPPTLREAWPLITFIDEMLRAAASAALKRCPEIGSERARPQKKPQEYSCILRLFSRT